MKNPTTRARLGAMAAASVVLTPVSLHAANYTWQTAGTTNNWSTVGTDTNWFIDTDTTLSPWADANAAIFDAAAGEAIALVGTVVPTTTLFNNNGTWSFTGTGVLGGAGTLTKNGSGTLTLANTTANTYSAGTTINGGILSLGTGGTAANTSTAAALGTGLVTVNTGSTLRLWIKNDAAFTIANNLSVNGGTISNEDGNYTLSGTLAVGASGATLRSKYTGKNMLLSGVLSGGGAVTVLRSEAGGAADSTVILTNSNTYSGGTTVNSAVLQLGNAVATDKGQVGVVRGTLTVNTPGNATLGFTNALGWGAGTKVDTLNINGATVSHTANGDQAWGVTYNFNAGTLQTTGTGRYSFGGGTSINTAASANSASINGSVQMRDSNPGNTVPVNTADGAALYDLALNANVTVGTTGVGFTKSGAGTMLVNGAGNNYTGGTIINGGTLVLGVAGNLATSPVTVNNTGTFRSDAVGKTLPALSATNGSTLVLPAVTGGTTTVTGALDLAAGATINVAPILGSATVNGTYDLVTAGSITGTGTLVATPISAYGPTRVTGTAGVSGNKLQFTVTGTGANLVWNNASAAGVATGTWDVNTTANFNNGGGNDVFQAFDNVTFDDTVAAGAAKTINLLGQVAPALITVNNSTNNDYTLTATAAGVGHLMGAAGITKSGAGALTLGANLNYVSTGGAISVGGGTFNLGGKTLPNQATFALTGGATLSNGTIPVTGSSNFQSGTISGAITGAGNFTKTTAGTVTLSGASNITGAGTISEGTLQVGAGAAAGTLGNGPVSIASGANLTFFRSDNPFAAVANVLSGAGTVNFNGTGVNLQSSYTLSGNNSGFSGTITSTNSRVNLDNANDPGTATLTTGTNGQFWITAGTYANPMNIAGNGWLETTGPFGAIRIAGSTLTGPITLTGNARIGGAGAAASTISSAIGETGGARSLEFGGIGGATTLTLSGASTYTGATAIGGAAVGTAAITLTGSLGNTAVTVNNGSSLAGNGSIAGSLSFAGATSTLGVNLGLPGTLTVAGAVNMGAGVTTVALTPAPGLTPGGSVPVLNYGSITGTAANFAIANPANYRQAIFNVGATSTTVDLGSKALTWTGTGGLVWDLATTTNWQDATLAATAFYNGDTVSFTDAAGAANANVTITAAGLAPAAITINNSTTVPYTFSGAGTVTGPVSLVKSGDGTALLNVGMPITGGTTINGGVLIVDSASAGNRQGNGNLITVNTGGTFEIRGVNALPNHGNSTSVVLNGGTLEIETGFSAAAPANGSHTHLNNITLNGGTVNFTYSGAGTAYNNESVQLNGTLTVGGSAASVIQSVETTANQGLALAAGRTFVVPDVTGSAASDLVITAEVENSDSNNGALTKTGAGTLELAAANSYSGGTTVSAGTLLISNGSSGSATGSGAVTVAAGATLTGQGSATGAVTVAGTIDPGSATTFTNTGALTVTGSYAAHINGTDASAVVVTGNINLSGATLNLTTSSVTESSYVIGSWTGTRTGAFGTVTGLPSGYSVQYDETNKLILVAVASGYTEWLADFPGLSDTTPNGDPDKDGIANLLEYILGGDPTLNSNSGAGILPTMQISGSNLLFTFKRSDDSESDTVQTVQWTTTLNGTWTDIAVNPTPAGSVSITENGAAADDVTVTIPLAGNVRMFVRLLATPN